MLYPMLLRCSRLKLTAGGPAPGGVRAANLTEATRPYLEEVALNEQVSGVCALLCMKSLCVALIESLSSYLPM